MKKRIAILLPMIPVISFLLFPLITLGQNQATGRQEAPIFKEILQQRGWANTAAELTSNDPREIVAKVIRIFLSLLGTIFVVLMLYGGYRWMNAQGEEEEVTKAKDLIRNAIIGLIIVLAAYTITSFIFNQLEAKKIIGK